MGGTEAGAESAASALCEVLSALAPSKFPLSPGLSRSVEQLGYGAAVAEDSTGDAMPVSEIAENNDAEPFVESVPGVPGARVVRGLLSSAECQALESVIRSVHGSLRQRHRLEGHRERRESQHHVALEVGSKPLETLAARLRPFLDEFAGPKSKKPLEAAGKELSSFLRTYCYEEGDFSAPHFDKAFTEHTGDDHDTTEGDKDEDVDKAKNSGSKNNKKKPNEKGGVLARELVRFSAFSVVMYLNEGFEGGATTFFKEDERIKPSRRGNTPIIEDMSILEVAGANVPRMGDVLVFPHGNMPGSFPNPLHEGSVLKKGSKCIIRTDVFYLAKTQKSKNKPKNKKTKKNSKDPEDNNSSNKTDKNHDKRDASRSNDDRFSSDDKNPEDVSSKKDNAHSDQTPHQNYSSVDSINSEPVAEQEHIVITNENSFDSAIDRSEEQNHADVMLDDNTNNIRPPQRLAKQPRLASPEPREGDPMVNAIETLLEARLAMLCPISTHLARGSVRRLNEPSKPEFESKLPSTIFWTLFRDQRADPNLSNLVAKNKVLLTSDMGVSRELTRDGLARALIDELPSEHPLAFICASDDGSGRLSFSSKVYVAEKSLHGQIMCIKCGAFVKAATGGLEWHMKNAHSVETHQIAFEAVQRQSDALFVIKSIPGADIFANSKVDENLKKSILGSVRLDPSEVARAMRDRDTLNDAVEAGRIKSLGPELDACRSGDIEALRKAVANGWNPRTSTDKNGANGLLWAAGFGNLEVCKFLVRECKLDPVRDAQNARRGYSGRTALHWAARNGHLRVVRWLIEEENSPVDASTGDGTTPLCLAAWQGHVDMCKYLVEEAKADPQTVNSFGCNMAMWVSQSPQHESAMQLCKYFAQLGVNFTLINHNGQGCLHKAAQRGNRPVCEWLLKQIKLGAEHFAPNENEKSRPFELAKFAGHDELAKYLEQPNVAEALAA